MVNYIKELSRQVRLTGYRNTFRNVTNINILGPSDLRTKLIELRIGYDPVVIQGHGSTYIVAFPFVIAYYRTIRIITTLPQRDMVAVSYRGIGPNAEDVTHNIDVKDIFEECYDKSLGMTLAEALEYTASHPGTTFNDLGGTSPPPSRRRHHPRPIAGTKGYTLNPREDGNLICMVGKC